MTQCKEYFSLATINKHLKSCAEMETWITDAMAGRTPTVATWQRRDCSKPLWKGECIFLKSSGILVLFFQKLCLFMHLSLSLTSTGLNNYWKEMSQLAFCHVCFTFALAFSINILFCRSRHVIKLSKMFQWMKYAGMQNGLIPHIWVWDFSASS